MHSALIDACKNQNKKAQLQIYKLYYKAMYNSSLRIVNNKEDAEDIMQEAFLAAFNNIESYKGEVSFGAWLKKIVVNKSIDYFRKNRVEFVEFETEKYENANEFENSDNEEFKLENYKNEIQKIIDTLKELPDGFRLVFSLYYLEGYDHEEISTILGIAPSTSRSQLTFAKKRLKKLLNRH